MWNCVQLGIQNRFKLKRNFLLSVPKGEKMHHHIKSCKTACQPCVGSWRRPPLLDNFSIETCLSTATNFKQDICRYCTNLISVAETFNLWNISQYLMTQISQLMCTILQQVFCRSVNFLLRCSWIEFCESKHL